MLTLLALALAGTGDWHAGVTFGAGFRAAPKRAVPDGLAPRLDLHLLTLQYELSETWRAELQLDPVHWWATRGATTAPRLPMTLYLSQQHPWKGRYTAVLSPGLYMAPGLDAVAIDERLRYRPATVLAVSGRVGLQRQRWLWPHLRSTWSVRADVGMDLNLDPDALNASRYVRVGVERSYVWGPR